MMQTIFSIRKVNQDDLSTIEKLLAYEFTLSVYTTDPKEVLNEFLSYDENEQIALIVEKNGEAIGLFTADMIDEVFAIPVYYFLPDQLDYLIQGLNLLCQYVKFNLLEANYVSVSVNSFDFFAMITLCKLGFKISYRNEYTADYKIQL